MTSRRSLLLALALAACGPARAVAPPTPAPAPEQPPSTPPVNLGLPARPAEVPDRLAPPAAAWRSGWMPSDQTGADRFLAAHPEWDGRGVIIAILDSGLDPTIPGLERTSTGGRKVLDLRDFSGEGRVALQRVPLEGPTLLVGGLELEGMARLRGFAVVPEAWVGTLAERRLGGGPAADLDGNGSAGDSLAVVVVRGPAGWLLFADTNRDGSLGDERPVRDFAVAGESFCWRAGPAPCRLSVAANLAGDGAEPDLHLVFDTSGHGSHVAGIAAGYAVYGVAGFDGVAPGAWLLGLKISDNANGSISTAGSMRAALAHAVAVARRRGAALVINLSFGVGNEREGTARIDALVDSVLAAHPDVVMTVSAGNDGPGLSTLGFPGSATRPISVGATFPLRFVERGPGAERDPDPVAWFSARGGELARPDVVAPGIAYSTVPAWRTGEERSAGTSMAAPHAAGLAALLMSGLGAEGRPIDAAQLRQALMATARPTPGATWLDEGAGVPDLPLAWAWLRGDPAVPRLLLRAPGGEWGTSGLLLRLVPGHTADTTVVVQVRRTDTPVPLRLHLQSGSAWIVHPASMVVSREATPLPVTIRPMPESGPTWATGLLVGRSDDPLLGGLLRLPVTLIRPVPAGADSQVSGIRLGRSALARMFFVADSGRPFETFVTSENQADLALSSLHTPGGMPYLERNHRTAASGGGTARYPVEGGEALPGVWELVAVAPPGRAGRVAMGVRHAPVRLRAVDAGDAWAVDLESVSRDTAALEAGLAIVGLARTVEVRQVGSGAIELPMPIPDWAADVQVDVRLAPSAWGRFTDFGLTLAGGDGRQVGHAPLNYALGRLTATLGQELAREGATLHLLPGLADPDDPVEWHASVTVRWYAAAGLEPHPLAEGPLALAPGQRARVRFDRTALPWGEDAAWRPLAVSWVQAASGLWTTEGAIGEAGT